MKRLLFRLRYYLYIEKDRNGRWTIFVRDKRKKKEYVLCEKYLAKKSAEDRIQEIYDDGYW